MRRRRPAKSRASVAIVLREGERGDEVLLTRRSARVGDPWSGHISLPGGRREPGDVDAVHTAIRETREELGLDLAGRCRGRMGDHITFEHASWWPMAIDPVIFRVDGDPEFTFNHEVVEAFWVPLAAMRSGELAAVRPWRLLGRDWQMPAWEWEGRLIWGLTYQMLLELRADPNTPRATR